IQGDEAVEEQHSLLFQPHTEWTQGIDVIKDDLHRARGRASIGSAYGAARSLIALLVWVYYSSLLVFFGAEFTHAWATRQRTVEPKSCAEPGAAPQKKSAAAAEQAAHTEDYDRSPAKSCDGP